MLASIYFNDEAMLEASKIENVILKWNLPPELESHEAAATQQSPQLTFGIRQFMTHRTRVVAL